MASANAHGAVKLSDLPDHTILRIMSFISVRQAGQVCVLSRRWRNLWRSLPCINIDFKEFNVTENEAGDEAVFKRFVNRLLEIPDDPVDSMVTFCLRYSMSRGQDGKADSADANRWIGHVLQNQAMLVEVVVLSYALELDHSSFTSCYLRNIRFGNVLLNKGFFKQIQTGCPALEDLFLHDCIIMDDEISTSQELKVLTIDVTKFPLDYKTSITTRSVTSLTLCSPVDGVPVLKDVASVVTASVVLNDDPNYHIDASDFRHYLWSLSGVKHLEFDYLGLMRRNQFKHVQLTMENDLQWCQKFMDLVSLTLGQWCLDANFYGLTVLLQNSPILEKLTLDLKKFPGEIRYQRIIGELEERSFTCEHLTSVEVICSEDDPLVNNVVDFFVNSGLNSSQINIKHEDRAKKFDE